MQPRHDARHRATLRRGREGDDRLASLSQGSATHEVHLPAHAAVDAVLDRVGAHLAGEVDFQGGVDGN